jgi:hypothetical protein
MIAWLERREEKRTLERHALGSHVWPGFNPSNITNPNSTPRGAN